MPHVTADVFLVQDLERREGRGEGSALTVIRSRHVKPGPVLHDSTATDERCDWPAVAESLAQRGHIGREVEVLLKRTRLCSKPGLHLVEDEQRAILVRPLD